MKTLTQSLMKLSLLCGATALGAFCISGLGALLHSIPLMLFWYLGLSALWLLPLLSLITGISYLLRHLGTTGQNGVPALRTNASHAGLAMGKTADT